ncbi:MAG: MFS transporter, partial [Planctomycetota bacterium]
MDWPGRHLLSRRLYHQAGLISYGSCLCPAYKLWLLSLPGVILALILFKVLTGEHETKRGARLSDLKILFVRKSRPLWIMFLIMFTRSVVITSFMSFMSILFTEKGLTMHQSGIAISTFLISGSIGGVIGGYLADKTGRKIIIAC